MPQLEFVQSVLWAAGCEGVAWLPLPFETDGQKGYVIEDGFVWELLPWFTGKKRAISEPMPQESIRSLVRELAGFHKIGKSFPVPNETEGVSPRVFKRLREWQHWVRSQLAELDAALNHMKLDVASLPEEYDITQTEPILAETVSLAKNLIREAIGHSGQLISLLSRAARIAVPQQPVLQSLYRRHLIFDEEQNHLSGLVDCCEMGIDGVAVDLAMLPAHVSPWESAETLRALADYRKIAGLSDREYYLMIALYHAETIMHPLDRLAMLFLPNQSCSCELLPNIVQIAMIREELQWSLNQIGNLGNVTT